MASLPSGPVTFLCVDVEGSTRLATDLGEHWGDVLARIRTAVRDAISAEGGVVVDARGDELFAAFEAAVARLALYRDYDCGTRQALDNFGRYYAYDAAVPVAARNDGYARLAERLIALDL